MEANDEASAELLPAILPQGDFDLHPVMETEDTEIANATKSDQLLMCIRMASLPSALHGIENGDVSPILVPFVCDSVMTWPD